VSTNSGTRALHAAEEGADPQRWLALVVLWLVAILTSWTSLSPSGDPDDPAQLW
jgi:hypothetical protein